MKILSVLVLSLVCMLCLHGCGVEQTNEEFKEQLIALERECLDKLEQDPLKATTEFPFQVATREFSLVTFCWCFVKELKPKNVCMEEASGN